MRRLLLAAAAFVAGLAAAAQAGPVLDRVRANNTVRCGVGGSVAGFSLPDSWGEWHGLDVDYCRAIASAVLGDPRRVTFVPLTLQTRFTALFSGEVDVLARDTVWTLSRDVSLGITFVGTSFYTGTGVMVRRALGVTRMTSSTARPSAPARADPIFRRSPISCALETCPSPRSPLTASPRFSRPSWADAATR